MFPILVLLAVVSGFPLFAQPADVVVENAVIYTMDARVPKASSLAVKDGRFLAVGEVKAHIGPQTKRLDAKGAAIVPGLIDSHVHMRGLGEMLESFDFRHARSVEEITRALAGRAAATPKGEWIQGRNWDQTNWGGRFPTADEISKAVPDHPVYLRRVDGHAAWVNRKALEIAGVTRETKDPAGGQILRDASGAPAGVLVDRAMGLVARHIPARTPAQVERALALAAKKCAELGLTGVHDAGISRVEWEAYQRLKARGELPVRVYAMVGGAGDWWRSLKEPVVDAHLSLRCLKLLVDGAMGSRGAAFWQPYADDKQNSGLLLLTKEQIEQAAREAIQKGFQVASHAIGDRANRVTLDGYAAALGGKNGKRFRVEHAQVISLPDFALYAANDVIASIQSTHATSDMRWAAARLGPDRMMGAWQTQRFLKAGIRIANGSDFPVEDPNPLWGFYAAVTRQDHQGNPPEGFMPDQRMTREEALRSWTMDGAYAAFEEQQKGSITPGKLADFVVLSRDIMTVPMREVITAKPVMTVLGGRVVHGGL